MRLGKNKNVVACPKCGCPTGVLKDEHDVSYARKYGENRNTSGSWNVRISTGNRSPQGQWERRFPS